MKRSDIVFEIENALEFLKDGDNGNYHQDANYLLDLIEKLGMLPPEREILVKASDRPQIDGITLLDYIDYQNSWDAE